MKKAVILFNLGGPDKLEDVEPFLFNLFNDPAILNLPFFFRYPLAKLISNRRTPTAKKIYKKFCEFVKPNAVNIDYEVDPKTIAKEIKIPVQGGLNPKILLGDKDQLKKGATKYLEIFKDHPYIFNLGHGILPETDPNMVDYLIKFVKDFK
jgi:hypothetical protein